MLQHLKIENYALIRSLDIDMTEGFCVITGETGAGKSILLGALNLVLGQRADSAILFDKSRKCVIEARFDVKGMDLGRFSSQPDGTSDSDSNKEEADTFFDIEDNMLVLRREVLPNGKSRAFVNDTPVNLAVLKELSAYLIDIHSQHQTLTLNTSAFQLNLVDSYLQDDTIPQRYRGAYTAYLHCQKKVTELESQLTQWQQDQDYWRFLLDELDKFAPKAGEQTEMEEALERLSHGELLQETLLETASALDGEEGSLRSRIEAIVRGLKKIAPYHKGVCQSLERWQSLSVELADLSADIERWADADKIDPALKERYEERLDELYRLERKHHVKDEESLVDLQQELRRKTGMAEEISETLVSEKEKLECAKKQLASLALEWHQARVASARVMEKSIMEALGRLGMRQSLLEIRLEAREQFTALGNDKICFLFSANTGAEPREISKVASGGELSRLMLAIKSVIHKKSLLGTIIFDEIDTGVSGQIAGKVAAMMKEMSSCMQVIAITHLPQIAAAAQAHFFVYKSVEDGVSVSKMKRLDQQEHVQAIASMLSNDKITEAALKAAQELTKG